jgi:CHAT domain-containing protein/Flp pilus assembly protein TadD
MGNRQPRAAMIALLSIFVALVSTSATPQQIDQGAAQTRFQELYAAGNYAGALAEAQQQEVAAKRNGTNNPAYMAALTNLAGANQALGRYASAAAMFAQVLNAFERNVKADDPTLAQPLSNLGTAYVLLGRYAEAQKLFGRALTLREKAPGPNNNDLVLALNDVANVYRKEARYGDAATTLRRALDIADADSSAQAISVGNLGRVYEDQGRFPEAEELYRRALAINEKGGTKSQPTRAMSINDVAHILEPQGHYVEAEALYLRAIGILEQTLGPGHPSLATALNNVAVVYLRQGRLDDAEKMFARALDIRQAVLGAGSPEVAVVYNNLAQVYVLQDRQGDAEAASMKALDILQKLLGPNHPDVAKVQRKLAVVYDAQGRYSDAQALLTKVIDNWTKSLGLDHPFVATALENLARVREHQSSYRDADSLYRRALVIQEKARGQSHPEVARLLDELAQLDAVQRNYAAAIDDSRKASAAIISHAFAETPGIATADNGDPIQKSASYFNHHVANLAAATRAGIASTPPVGQEAFEIAQWASQSSAAAALQQAAVRFASGDGALVSLARENQDLGATWRDADRRLLDALASPDSPENRATIDVLRKQMADIESRLAIVAASLEKEFPAYGALMRPKPLSVGDVQSLLDPSEALVFWLPGEKESYGFALTQSGFDWHSIPKSAEQLSEAVATFRTGLDPNQFIQSAEQGKLQQFDLGVAYELYLQLLGPVEALIKDKRNLITIAAGALTALPVHALVTEKPPEALPKRLRDYRDAAWLVKRHSVTVLPSVASLRALRSLPRAGEAVKPMIGFGDPIFSPNPPAAGKERDGTRALEPAYTAYWRGANLNRAALRNALRPLPDTAVELKTIAERLGAPMSDIHLGADATETTLKNAGLSDFRIIYFATHGLVAGDVKGLAEPALVLTFPLTPTEHDDGLLTASKIATELKLNADWAVLSACNTMAGDKPGAEALSGLARAFFYAGARALLVSHWAVDSKAATRLAIATFDAMSTGHMSRAEALRHAMLGFMNDESSSLNAYPAYWAPFAVIGEGLRQ